MPKYNVEIVEENGVTAIKIQFPADYDRDKISNLMGSLEDSEGIGVALKTLGLNSDNCAVKVDAAKHIGILTLGKLITDKERAAIQQNIRRMSLEGSFAQEISNYLERKADLYYGSKSPMSGGLDKYPPLAAETAPEPKKTGGGNRRFRLC